MRSGMEAGQEGMPGDVKKLTEHSLTTQNIHNTTRNIQWQHGTLKGFFTKKCLSFKSHILDSNLNDRKKLVNNPCNNTTRNIQWQHRTFTIQYRTYSDNVVLQHGTQHNAELDTEQDEVAMSTGRRMGQRKRTRMRKMTRKIMKKRRRKMKKNELKDKDQDHDCGCAHRKEIHNTIQYRTKSDNTEHSVTTLGCNTEHNTQHTTKHNTTQQRTEHTVTTRNRIRWR